MLYYIQSCFISVGTLVATSPRRMDPKGRTWERVVSITRQPRSAPTTKIEDGSEEQFSGTLLEDIRIRNIFQAEIVHLSTYFESEAPKGYKNTMHGYDFNDEITTTANKALLRASVVAVSRLPVIRDLLPKKKTPYNSLIKDGDCVIYDVVLKPGKNIDLRAFPRAGPRESLHFNPKTVNAAILTCGGLCPGLNVVVRSLTHSLI